MGTAEYANTDPRRIATELVLEQPLLQLPEPNPFLAARKALEEI